MSERISVNKSFSGKRNQFCGVSHDPDEDVLLMMTKAVESFPHSESRAATIPGDISALRCRRLFAYITQ